MVETDGHSEWMDADGWPAPADALPPPPFKTVRQQKVWAQVPFALPQKTKVESSPVPWPLLSSFFSFTHALIPAAPPSIYPLASDIFLVEMVMVIQDHEAAEDLQQLFQWHSGGDFNAVQAEFDPETGKNVVFLQDIQVAYPGTFFIKDAIKVVPYLKDKSRKQ